MSIPGLRCMRHLRKHAQEEPAGIAVDAAAEPELLALVAQECAAIGVAMPAAVHLSLEHSVRVTRARGVRTLVIGAPLAVTVPEPVLRVAVSHAVLRDCSRLTRLLDPWRSAPRERLHLGCHPLLRPWRAFAQAAWNASPRRSGHAPCSPTWSARGGWALPGGRTPRLQLRVALFAYDYPAAQVAPCLEGGVPAAGARGMATAAGRSRGRRFIVAEPTRDLSEQPHPGRPLPTLGARLAAIEACAPTGSSLGCALSLHRPAGAVEEAVLRAADNAGGGALVEIAWERVAEAVWLPRMRAQVASWHDALEDCTLPDRRTLGQRADLPLQVLGEALAVALHRHGWELGWRADAVRRVVSDEHEPLVLQVAACLAAEGDDERAWERFVEGAQFAGRLLRPPGDDAPSRRGPRRHRRVAEADRAGQRPLRGTRAVRRRTFVALTIAGLLGGSVCATMLAVALAGTGDNLQPVDSIVGRRQDMPLLAWRSAACA